MLKLVLLLYVNNIIRKIYNLKSKYPFKGVLFVLQADRFCQAPLAFWKASGMVARWGDVQGILAQGFNFFWECKSWSRLCFYYVSGMTF